MYLKDDDTVSYRRWCFLQRANELAKALLRSFSQEREEELENLSHYLEETKQLPS